MDQMIVVLMGPSTDPLMSLSMDPLMDHFVNSSVDPLMGPSNGTSLEHIEFDELHQMILVCARIMMLLENYKESCSIDWKFNGKTSSCWYVPCEH